MQKQDYERISSHIRAVRDASAERGYGVNVCAAFREFAVQLAKSFSDVNPRFKVDQFLIDALGQTEGDHALNQLHQEMINDG